MAVDTPARIAVLGAGPVGLEAALYARFLGYDVDIFERETPGANLMRWGHVRMFSPFGLNSSSLGLAALAAQDADYRPPHADEILTGRQWCERYVRPLSQTDLLADHIHHHSTVLGVTKAGLLKTEAVGQVERDDAIFRILVRDQQGRESNWLADVVIDSTGVYGNPNWLGDGGIPALGEIQHQSRIEYGIPDVLGCDRDRYANRRTLLVGGGYSAATTAIALQQLIDETPGTQVTWLTRKQSGDDALARIPGDGLIERDQLVHAANRLTKIRSSRFRYLPDRTIMRIDPRHGDARSQNDPDCRSSWVVEIQQRSGSLVESLVESPIESLECDELIANVGYRPDATIYSELQFHECYATQGPMKLAAAISKSSADCLRQQGAGPTSLMNPEPHFYVLGAKSYGRNSHFLFRSGLEQIRDLFTVIGDRETLDLYAGTRSLPS